jgi:hypothetical protein
MNETVDLTGLRAGPACDRLVDAIRTSLLDPLVARMPFLSGLMTILLSPDTIERSGAEAGRGPGEDAAEERVHGILCRQATALRRSTDSSIPLSSSTSALVRRARRCAAEPSRANSIWARRSLLSKKLGRSRLKQNPTRPVGKGGSPDFRRVGV